MSHTSRSEVITGLLYLLALILGTASGRILAPMVCIILMAISLWLFSKSRRGDE